MALEIEDQISRATDHKVYLMQDLNKQKWRRQQILLLEKEISDTITQRENEIQELNEHLKNLNDVAVRQ